MKNHLSKTCSLLLLLLLVVNAANALTFFSQQTRLGPTIFIVGSDPNADRFATNGLVGSMAIDLTDTNSLHLFVKCQTNQPQFFLVTQPVTGPVDFATNSAHAVQADNASIADYASTAGNAGNATTAYSATYIASNNSASPACLLGYEEDTDGPAQPVRIPLGITASIYVVTNALGDGVVIHFTNGVAYF